MKKVILLTGLTLSLCACADDPATNSNAQVENTVNKGAQSNISTLNLHVQGMTCRSCENAIKRELMGHEGILEVSASHSKESVVVSFDADKVSSSDIKEAIRKLGYQVS